MLTEDGPDAPLFDSTGIPRYFDPGRYLAEEGGSCSCELSNEKAEEALLCLWVVWTQFKAVHAELALFWAALVSRILN